MCVLQAYGNASVRMAEIVPTGGTYAYGGFADIDELYARQLTETDRAKREATLHQINGCCTSGPGLRRSSTMYGQAGWVHGSRNRG